MTESIRSALEAKKVELAKAKAELDSWREYDARRDGGSGAQDRRHEEIGESLRRAVSELTAEVGVLESQVG